MDVIIRAGGNAAVLWLACNSASMLRMSGLFDVHVLCFRGDPQQTKAELARCFGLDQGTASRLVDNVPLAVKRGADRATAEEYAAVLRALGGEVQVLGQGAPSLGPPPPASDPPLPRPTQPPPGALSFLEGDDDREFDFGDEEGANSPAAAGEWDAASALGNEWGELDPSSQLTRLSDPVRSLAPSQTQASRPPLPAAGGLSLAPRPAGAPTALAVGSGAPGPSLGPPPVPPAARFSSSPAARSGAPGAATAISMGPPPVPLALTPLPKLPSSLPPLPELGGTPATVTGVGLSFSPAPVKRPDSAAPRDSQEQTRTSGALEIDFGHADQNDVPSLAPAAGYPSTSPDRADALSLAPSPGAAPLSDPPWADKAAGKPGQPHTGVAQRGARPRPANDDFEEEQSAWERPRPQGSAQAAQKSTGQAVRKRPPSPQTSRAAEVGGRVGSALMALSVGGCILGGAFLLDRSILYGAAPPAWIALHAVAFYVIGTCLRVFRLSAGRALWALACVGLAVGGNLWSAPSFARGYAAREADRATGTLQIEVPSGSRSFQLAKVRVMRTEIEHMGRPYRASEVWLRVASAPSDVPALELFADFSQAAGLDNNRLASGDLRALTGKEIPLTASDFVGERTSRLSLGEGMEPSQVVGGHLRLSEVLPGGQGGDFRVRGKLTLFVETQDAQVVTGRGSFQGRLVWDSP